MIRSRSYIATPPGATIKEQLEDRGMSQKEFALRMEMSEKHISNLINGAVQLTPSMAYRLEMVLGLPASFWSSLESRYREKLERVQEENALDDDLEIAKHFPVKKMVQLGWIPDADNKTDRVIALRKFFEVVHLASLLDPSLVPHIACRRQAVTEKADYSLIAWVQEAKIEARQIPTASINLKELNDQLPAIRAMTTQDPSIFSSALADLLSDCGIALVYLPHIAGSFLHGATFCDGNKIVIGLTLRGKDADKFWFSLFHEIGHVLLGHLNKKDGTDAEDEDNADRFARDTLIPKEEFDAFVDSRDFSRESIIDFAQKIGIDPGIVVGRLQKESYIEFSWYHDLKKQYELIPED